MNASQAIAQILKAEGIEWLSAFPAQPLIDQAARAGIRPVICRQERTGVNMADGFSRTTNGRPFGIFTMQVGPGAENAFGGAAQAYADSIPLLLLPGGAAADRTQVPPNFDAVANYREITKWAANINQVERIPELIPCVPSIIAVVVDPAYMVHLPQSALFYRSVHCARRRRASKRYVDRGL